MRVAYTSLGWLTIFTIVFFNLLSYGLGELHSWPTSRAGNIELHYSSADGRTNAAASLSYDVGLKWNLRSPELLN